MASRRTGRTPGPTIMSAKPPPPSREDRLAKALRENLARRKALVRAKRARANADDGAPAVCSADRPAERPARDETSS
jgi:hypothetical protein